MYSAIFYNAWSQRQALSHGLLYMEKLFLTQYVCCWLLIDNGFKCFKNKLLLLQVLLHSHLFLHQASKKKSVLKFNRSKYTFQILEVFSPLLLSSQRLLGVFWKFPWWAWGENAPSTYHMTEKERRRYFFPPDSILILDICWSMVFFWMLAFFFLCTTVDITWCDKHYHSQIILKPLKMMVTL